jgi:DNA polymerase-3 subunit epsilon
VTALLHALDYRSGDGTTVVGRLLDRGGRADWIIDAGDAPISAEDVLRERIEQ